VKALRYPAWDVLDIADVPDLYLTQFPLANAATIGAGKPIVVLNSELVDLLDDSQLRVVLAHEAAHVLSDHVLYTTALLIVLQLGHSMRIPLLAGLPVMAIEAALLEWFRAAELSCDRAAAIAVRDPIVVCRSLMTLSAGAAADKLNLDAFMAQAADYQEKGSGVERLSRLLAQMNLTHPLPVRRVRELMDWVHGGDYERIVGGEYIRRGEEPAPREEADAATAHYSERLKSVFSDVGSSVADIGSQLGDWLNRTKQ